jgi:hypothetical protein
MRKRRITLHDGRYLIFYTFEDERTPLSHTSSDKETGEGRQREKEAGAVVVLPQAEEERRV